MSADIFEQEHFSSFNYEELSIDNLLKPNVFNQEGAGMTAVVNQNGQVKIEIDDKSVCQAVNASLLKCRLVILSRRRMCHAAWGDRLLKNHRSNLIMVIFGVIYAVRLWFGGHWSGGSTLRRERGDNAAVRT